ncbi:unnamed protein product [Trifolium pratense]|uniref:Uncharacterized protein n=1 Tax=Trifolium pratense TaxID=57577 RepID=A0ACB0ILD6_TRIPR|nr:unnamed protein product [Trifolium pratense]
MLQIIEMKFIILLLSMCTEHDSFWTGCRLHFFVVSLEIEMIGTWFWDRLKFIWD